MSPGPEGTLRYGGGSQADRWVRPIAADLKAGQVQEVIARLQRMRPETPELRQSLQALIRYYSDNAARMHHVSTCDWAMGLAVAPSKALTNKSTYFPQH